jgi:hypothetical protein
MPEVPEGWGVSKRVVMALIQGLGWVIGTWKKEHDNVVLSDPRVCIIQDTKDGKSIGIGKLIGSPEKITLLKDTFYYDVVENELVIYYVKEVSGLILPTTSMVKH